MRGLTKSRLRWHNAFFYMIYAVVILAVAAVVAYYLRGIWARLADYEAAQPKYVMDGVVETVEKGDYEAMLALEGDVPYADLTEEYAAYMKSLSSGEVTYRSARSSEDEGNLVYNLYVGDVRMYKIVLSLTGEVNAHGYELWGLSRVENYNIAYATYRVQAPQTSKVYADDKLLAPGLIVERGIETGVEEHLLTGILPPTNVVYELDTYFGEPVFRAVDWKDRPQELVMEDKVRVAQTVYDDEEMRPEFEENVLSVAQAFARFTIGDASASSMLKLTCPDSRAYDYVRNFDTSWFFATFGHSFANGRTENYVLYRDDYFSCDVYFDFTVKYRQETRTYNSAYTLYFMKGSGGWQLYDIVTR